MSKIIHLDELIFIENNSIFIRHRQYQSTMEVRLGELQSEVKLKTFELDRFQLLYEENLKSLKTTQIQLEKFEKKTDVCLSLRLSWIDQRVFIDLVNSKRIF